MKPYSVAQVDEEKHYSKVFEVSTIDSNGSGDLCSSATSLSKALAFVAETIYSAEVFIYVVYCLREQEGTGNQVF